MTSIWIWKGFQSETDYVNYALQTNNKIIHGYTYTDQYYPQNHYLIEHRQKNSTILTLIVNTSSNILLSYGLSDPNHFIINNVTPLWNISITYIGEGIKYIDKLNPTIFTTIPNKTKSIGSYGYTEVILVLLCIFGLKKRKNGLKPN